MTYDKIIETSIDILKIVVYTVFKAYITQKSLISDKL